MLDHPVDAHNLATDPLTKRAEAAKAVEAVAVKAGRWGGKVVVQRGKDSCWAGSGTGKVAGNAREEEPVREHWVTFGLLGGCDNFCSLLSSKAAAA